MKHQRIWLVAVFSSAFLVPAEYVKMRDASGDGGTGGGPGGGTINGLHPASYHQVKLDLDAVMRFPSSKVTAAMFKAVFDGAEEAGEAAGHAHQGGRLWADVVGCALRAGEPFTVGSFKGEGLMTPDATVGAPWKPVLTPWPGDIGDVRASVERREDIHTCLAARMNASATPVPIYLSGAHVAPRPWKGLDTPNLYPYAEAVWLATVKTGGVEIHVWPLQDLDRSCASDSTKLEAVLQKRICAGSDACDLTVHPRSDLADSCMETSDGIWWCQPRSGVALKPAIATRLGNCGWQKRYRLKSGADVCKPPWSTPPDLRQCDDPSIP
jgi:hypothetical protein